MIENKKQNTESLQKSSVQWEIEVPIFHDPVILRQLGIAIGIPFGMLIIILIIATGGDTGSLYALGLIGALFLLTFIFIKLVYRGKYAAGFIIDQKGILNYTQEKQAKKNRIINSLTVVLGLMTGKVTAAGAGFLAQSRQSVFVRWNRVRKVKCYPKSRTILIKGGFAETIAVFCTKENYDEIDAMIKSKIQIKQ